MFGLGTRDTHRHYLQDRAGASAPAILAGLATPGVAHANDLAELKRDLGIEVDTPKGPSVPDVGAFVDTIQSKVDGLVAQLPSWSSTSVDRPAFLGTPFLSPSSLVRIVRIGGALNFHCPGVCQGGGHG